MPQHDREIGPEEITLVEDYPSIREFAIDYKLKTRLGWRVVKVLAPEESGRRGLPLCVLRRFSQRYRYHVVFVRQRF